MPDRYPAKNPEMAWRVYEGQAAILCPDDSTLNTLNAVGTLIWEAADGRTSLSAIVARICAEFDVEPTRAEHDARAFVETLSRRGLLMVSDCPHEVS
ncbi:MAG: PqqD family protein [Candidatus Rokuibacteriota bacterium]